MHVVHRRQPIPCISHENQHLFGVTLHSSYFSHLTRTPYCCTYLKKQGSSAVKFRAPFFASNSKTFDLVCFLTWTFLCYSSPWPSFSALRVLVQTFFLIHNDRLKRQNHPGDWRLSWDRFSRGGNSSSLGSDRHCMRPKYWKNSGKDSKTKISLQRIISMHLFFASIGRNLY